MNAYNLPVSDTQNCYYLSTSNNYFAHAMKPTEIIAAFYAAGAICDLDAITALFSKNAVWDNRIDDDPMGGLYEGREMIRTGLLEPLFQFLPGGIKTHIERVLETGESAVCLNSGSGITVAGERFEKRYAHFFDCSNGRIERVTEFRA
jgi:ketosteroid isomerase-like protein